MPLKLHAEYLSFSELFTSLTVGALYLVLCQIEILKIYSKSGGGLYCGCTINVANAFRSPEKANQEHSGNLGSGRRIHTDNVPAKTEGRLFGCFDNLCYNPGALRKEKMCLRDPLHL